MLLSGCPDTYENMITRMGEIEKTLAAIKDTVTTASGWYQALLCGSVSQGLGTTKFMNSIGLN